MSIAKLQTEVHRLQEALQSKRLTHMQLSDHTLQDARTQIQLMQSGRLSRNEHEELARVLESLVNDNELVKRDNAELQQLLSDCREDFHALQEEVEEQRLNQELPRKCQLRFSLVGCSQFLIARASSQKQSIAASLSVKEFSVSLC